MEILEHEQHRRGGCPVGEPRERVLEDPQLRAGRRPICPQGLPERPQCLDERLERQLRADEIDRAPEEDLEAGVAGASGELGRQAGLADAGFSGDEDGRTVSQLHRVEHRARAPRARVRVRRRRRSREPPSRPVSRRAHPPAALLEHRAGGRYGGLPAKIRPSARCAHAPRWRRSVKTTTTRRRAMAAATDARSGRADEFEEELRGQGWWRPAAARS